MPTELFARLSTILDETFAATTMAGNANWNGGGFGGVLGDIHTIVPHQTAGWPPRNSGHNFVRRYTTRRYGENGAGAVVPCGSCGGPALPPPVVACDCKWGVGPQYYISYDGTVARVIGDVRHQERLTFHGNHVSAWSIGVETGNLFTTARPPGGWIRASRTPAVEDLPGANLWFFDHRWGVPREVIACWWTTANWRLPMREPVAAADAVRMLFSEQQYRAWSRLARFLAEQFNVPRNFPVLPHAQRGDETRRSAAWRRILLADPNFDGIIATFPAGWNMGADQFLPANAAALEVAYDNRTVSVDSDGDGDIDFRHNGAWTRMIEHFRGFHGHGFSGHNGGHDHDCPGPLFDWHRLAREVWDWWWFPFDLRALVPAPGQFTTAAGRRPDARADGNTPLLEYFWDEQGDPLVPGSQHASRARDGIHGNESSPATFRLEPSSPVYAMANGELVAARLEAPDLGPVVGGRVSLAFALVRHEVFHQPAPAAAAGGAAAPAAGRIDYDVAPATIYSLYMHLGSPAGISFDAVSVDNPDWLNRVIVRRKECQLGIAHFDGDPAHVPPIPAHPGAPAVAWTSQPPGLPARPTLIDGWRADDAALRTFIDDLRAGRVALAPHAASTMPIEIILGDFLGLGGTVDVNGPVHGVRVEAFSPAFLPPGFVPLISWVLGALVPNGLIPYESEWAHTYPAAEQAAFDARGIDPVRMQWWPQVAAHVAADLRALPPGARLPLDGVVNHVRPLEVTAWINGVTWRSEWPKYRVAGAAPARSRSRRV